MWHRFQARQLSGQGQWPVGSGPTICTFTWAESREQEVKRKFVKLWERSCVRFDSGPKGVRQCIRHSLLFSHLALRRRLLWGWEFNRVQSLRPARYSFSDRSGCWALLVWWAGGPGPVATCLVCCVLCPACPLIESKRRLRPSFWRYILLLLFLFLFLLLLLGLPLTPKSNYQSRFLIVDL